MNLVIVESPSKAKTINKYLGKNYKVLASKGHVVDLPKSDLGVDVENNFEPDYVVTKKQSLADLKKAYKGAESLVLAMDLDREGEAIAWHIAQKLGAVDKKGKPKKGVAVSRIVFNEISKDAVQNAMQNPRDIDMNLVNAQQARRVLDRLVGYKLSPLLWKKISFGLSAGRVQSAAVKLIVEREEDRNKFIKEEYWDILGGLKETKTSFDKINIFKVESKETVNDDSETDNESEKDLKGIIFKLLKFKGKEIIIESEEKSQKIAKEVQNEDWIISKIEKKNKTVKPFAPLITSTLQRSAVNVFGFTSKRVMDVAQKLYEAGLITYMRTDSTFMSAAAIDQARKYIKTNLGPKYLPEKVNIYSKQSKNAQEAHECIRPVDFTKTADDLSLEPDQKKIYSLIWQRALASQMSNAEFEMISATIEVKDYTFRANGSRRIFDGFQKISKSSSEDKILPDLKEGQKLFLETINCIQHFTKPPARYSEASLIKKMEELGIGRPSTYASIISTIQARKYVEKEGKYFKPTDIAFAVNSLLNKYFNEVVDYDFTAEMEEKLDKIADGKQDWVKMMSDFYFPFEKRVLKNDKDIPREEFTKLGNAPKDIKCPVCEKSMVIKLGRFGKFYSCSDYPKCKGMLSIDTKEDESFEKTMSEYYKEAPKTEDGKTYELKKSRFGYFWAHPEYPKVKDSKPLELKDSVLIELFGEPPKTTDGINYLLKKGKFGYFWAHPNYPAEKDIQRVTPLNKDLLKTLGL